MDKLWSLGTTIRNPERIADFFPIIATMDGEQWNAESQIKLQSKLIQHRLYVPTPTNLTDEQILLINSPSIEMTYAQARDIFDSKRYRDAPMRGRTSFDPVEKLGLVYLNDDIITVSDLGNKFLNDEIDFGEVLFTSFMKLQYPNPLIRGYNHYNTKPFINALRLIRKVNQLCAQNGMTVKGVSKDEFGIFVLSIKDYREVDRMAQDLIDYRIEKETISDYNLKKDYIENFTETYLSTFQSPVNNTKEYTDNMIRCVRLTRYIFIRGNGYYIDLEPRRSVEINAILDNDTGAALDFNEQEWKEYMGDYDAYELPFENIAHLKTIASNIISEINELNISLSQDEDVTDVESYPSKEELKELIEEKRSERNTLQSLQLKQQFSEASKIDEAIYALENIRDLTNKPSIELEKWSTIALNIINDATQIKPNYPVGDDNEPTFTAPSKVPDIECYYESFNAICEVTMLGSRDQWVNEGQPVMRHFRDFEESNTSSPNYCLFVAPTIHQDTLNTFWISVKYEYMGSQQKIIPITINQLISILTTIRTMKEQGKQMNHRILQQFYEACTDVSTLSSSEEWKIRIRQNISQWDTELTTVS